MPPSGGSWQEAGKNSSMSRNESKARISLFKQRRGKKQVTPQMERASPLLLGHEPILSVPL